LVQQGTDYFTTLEVGICGAYREPVLCWV
jgi:hypothetical protein